MIARSAPTSADSSSGILISRTVPATGDGISVSTLSVDTSSKGSSTSTVSPTCLSHRVTVPSVTLSPRAGIWTEKAMVSLTPRAFQPVPGSAVHVQRLAGKGEECLADGFGLRWVGVDQRGDVLRERLP